MTWQSWWPRLSLAVVVPGGFMFSAPFTRRSRAWRSGQRRGQLGQSLLLQRLHLDALHPGHIDEFGVESPAAGGVQALGRVALPEAEQLVAPPHLGPREGAVKEPVGKFSHRRSRLGRDALDAVGPPGGVGGELGWVVFCFGGAAALGLADVGLDQPAP